VFYKIDVYTPYSAIPQKCSFSRGKVGSRSEQAISIIDDKQIQILGALPYAVSIDA